MNGNAIRELTLSSWAADVWEKQRRLGVSLKIDEAALAYCMRQHTEWWETWNRLGSMAKQDTQALNILVHVYNDASVKLQLDRNDPPEINSLYQLLRNRGMAEMDALHAIAPVLQERTRNARNRGESFDVNNYIERAKSVVQMLLDNPKPFRSSTLRAI